MSQNTLERVRVLTDVQRGVWTDHLDLGPGDLGLPKTSNVRIRKWTFRGGLSDGVEAVEVRSGPLSFTVLPTRGMSLWQAEYHGVRVGWRSPVTGPVHPAFVHLSDRGGLGFLAGFDECVVRCGLEFNGAPGPDVVLNNRGEAVPMNLTLHGRIANLPAHEVGIGVRPGDPPEVAVWGVVDEAMLFGPALRLRTVISAPVGGHTVRVRDEVINRRGAEAEMQLLYHCNFGPPWLGAGARLCAPVDTVAPRDARAAEEANGWAEYRGPTPGDAEQVYWLRLRSDAKGWTVAALRSPQGDRAVAVRFNTHSLPYFTQWKCTAAEECGYVTGLEPATNFPNPRSFERRHGRVVRLVPGGSFRTEVVLDIRDQRAAVEALEREVAELQGNHMPVVHVGPREDWSPIPSPRRRRRLPTRNNGS